jgi:hypothetical protein
MANQTQQTRLRRHPVPPSPSERQSGADGLVAGIALLLIAALAAFGILMALERLVTPDDPARTAESILNSEGVFRAGIGSLYVLVILDVVVAWALFRYFRPVDAGLARLAAWLRLAYSGVLMVAVSELTGVPRLLRGSQPAAEQHVQALQRIDAFYETWDAAIVLFGCHLLVIGHLAWRSGTVPRLIGVLLAVAGVGYLSDSLGSVLFAGYPGDIATYTFAGELLLAVWLVVRGRHMPRSGPASGAGQRAPVGERQP